MEHTISLIGNTPMYKMTDYPIYIKLEKFNVGGSIKDRTVLGLLQEGFAKHKITKETVIVEASSGNTGIALAMLGAVYKIPVIILMPASMSVERRNLIKAYGAKLILTDAKDGMLGAVEKQKQLVDTHEHYISLSQFQNPANPNFHYETTAKEIYEEVPQLDIFVAGVGTGGSFSGISKYLKQQNSNIRCIAGEPKNSGLLSGYQAGSHKIQGIGANFIPDNFWKAYCDDVMLIKDEEAMEETKRFVRETGIFVGISSGANIALAKRLTKYYPEKTIVTIAPDGGEKYLSVLEFDDESTTVSTL